MASFRQMTNVGSRKNTLEVERENFEKTQSASIQKAVNAMEAPTKQKHVRNAILGTFQEQGCGMFWSVMQRQPLQGNAIVCWKFCHVLHKLIRDGHQNVIHDSLKYRSHLTDLGRLWGHLKDGFGRLNACYTSLLEKKLAFHKKYKAVPGNMVMTKELITEITGNDANGFFELAVDLLDYMDEILVLQSCVFGSLDMSRSNSMTSAGQCRLAPLIPCIQESALLYDHIVKLLFKLHSLLPPDTLSGHRERFYTQFKSLRQFYYNSQNLQYFKNLVQVPNFPENPPNFLKASDLQFHKAPVVVVPGEDMPDTEPPDFEEPSPPMVHAPPEPAPPPEPVTATLIQQPDARDMLIDQLRREIDLLKRQIETVKAQAVLKIEQLNSIIQKLENELKDQKEQVTVITKEKAMILNQLEMVETQAQATDKLQEAEKIAKSRDEKFQKLKEIYSKLREEHVGLLRQHAEASKQLNSEKKATEAAEKSKKELEERLEELEQEKSSVEHETLQKASEADEQLASCNIRITEMEEARKASEDQMAALEEEKKSLLGTVEKTQLALDEATAELDKLRAEKQVLEESFNKQADATGTELVAVKLKVTELEQEKQSLATRVAELEAMKKSLEEDVEMFQGDLKRVNDQTLEATMENERLCREFEEAEAALKEASENLQRELEDYKKKYEDVLKEKDAMEERLRQEMVESRNRMLRNAIEDNKSCLKKAVDSLDEPLEPGVTCTAEFMLGSMEPLTRALDQLKCTTEKFSTDQSESSDLVRSLTEFTYKLSSCVRETKAVSTAATIEQGEALLAKAKEVGEDGLQYLTFLEQGDLSKAVGSTSSLSESISQLHGLVEDLVPKIADVKAGEIGEMVTNEMEATMEAIEKAAHKIEDMLQKSREADTGVKLEVNERILDSCTALMKAIRVLVHKAKVMQEEIVSQGRGSASSKDFYKRHHRWTEGLLSAAKAVGWGANVLLETAEKVVNGKGKFEELMVCSQEIAASTAQLVVASKVKADRGSVRMKELSEASKGVTQATGNVVASAKTGAEMIEESDMMDFSNLTLHQAKRLEMNSQVRVLELESLLEKERVKFAELRRTHYQLAAERDQEEQTGKS